MHTPLRRYITRRLASFRYAFAGLAYVLRSQPNAWIHSAAALLVIAASLWLGLSPAEWGLIVVAIGAVMAAEIINTAIEAAIDLASPQPHPLAQVAKDCGAAAVLVTAGMAVMIGVLLLGPKLWDRLG